MNIMSIEFPRWATMICFTWWAIGTITLIFITILSPEEMSGKIDNRNWRHLVLKSTLLAWIGMWCFRFSFYGKLWGN
jgi:hypothetical protein